MSVIGLTSIVLLLLGFIFAIILYIASKVFKVDTDPRIDAINEILPGANCGACGYAGCLAFAEKVVKGEAPIDGCVAGGEKVAELIAKIMGKTVSGKKIKYVARVRCNGGINNSKELFKYQGVMDCRSAALIADGFKQCDYGCLGLGSCVNACPFFAITLNENKIPEVNENKCTGCGKCVEACPKNIIELQPYNKHVYVKCVSHYKGKVVASVCKVGCIACKRCEKVCPVGAIKVIDNVAVIDYEKCIDCGKCADVCPRNIIIDLKKDFRYKREISDKCVGCGLCKKVCPVDAITGERKQKHIIDPEKCIGCGLCEEKCPVNAIGKLKK